MKTKEQEPSISKDISISQVVTKVNSIFSMARVTKPTADELNLIILRELITPTRKKSPSGRSKFTKYMQGYILGCVQTNRELLWNDLEFCYLVEGVLYSTNRQTTKRSTKEFYDSNRGHLILPLAGEFYWKNSNKPFTQLRIVTI